MKRLPERPAIRPFIEVKEQQVGDQTVFILKDSLRLSDRVLQLPPAFLAICQLLDGKRTLPEVAAEFARRYGRHGADLPLDQLEEFIAILDEACLLEGGAVEAAVSAWRKDPIRKPACAGGSYPDGAKALAAFLDATYVRPGGPGALPDRSARAKPIRGVLSPHIDFHRGGHAYAHAWKSVAESCEADLFVVFGTAHAGTASARFALTKKSYETPLGTIETDADLVDRLVASYEGADDLFQGELAHKGEHSIEFQMVELAHLYGERSRAPRKVRALPVLCGSIHDLTEGPKKPSTEPRVKAFHDALAKALADTKPERICFVGGVDLFHVGADFDDPFALTEKKLETYLEQDRKTLAIVTDEQDADRFHADVSRDETRKICGHSPIHATLAALDRFEGERAGELLCHDRWYDGRSSVSFCSVVFRDGKKRKP